MVAEDYSDCSHNNLSGRENKSEIDAHHLSFSDNDNKKKRYKQVRSPLLQKSGELSRTFEMGTDDIIILSNAQKGKTVIFQSRKLKNKKYFEQKEGSNFEEIEQ